ncbi:MAG: hypothetical protein AAF772_02315 [Acidobacteriota bacterium]
MRLPRQLSPQAKKAALTADGRPVAVVVTVSPTTDRERFRTDVDALDARDVDWLGDRQVTLEIDDERLVDLAQLLDVVLIELPARLSRAPEPPPR